MSNNKESINIWCLLGPLAGLIIGFSFCGFFLMAGLKIGEYLIPENTALQWLLMVSFLTISYVTIVIVKVREGVCRNEEEIELLRKEFDDKGESR